MAPDGAEDIPENINGSNCVDPSVPVEMPMFSPPLAQLPWPE